MFYNSTFSPIYQPQLTNLTPDESRLNLLIKQRDATRGYGIHAANYLDNGYAVVPVAYGCKAPSKSAGHITHADIHHDTFEAQLVRRHKGSVAVGDVAFTLIANWTDLTHDDILNGVGECAHWHRYPNTGLCVLTGPNQGGLFCLDVDFLDDNTSKAVASAIDELLPPSAPIIRRKGSKGFAQFFRIDSDYPLPNKLFVEGCGEVDLLFTGRQSVLPPSVHPSGKRYEWITEDTLEETHIEDLPVLTEELFNQIIEILGSYGEVTFKGDARSVSKSSSEFEDSFDRWVASEALKVADDWIHDLDLARLEKVSDDFWVAVPSFRSSSTGRPDSQRTQNLHFTPKLIVDRGGSFRHWPLDRLVAECLGISNDETWVWLQERVPELKQPAWEPNQTPKADSIEPNVIEEQPYNPLLAAYEEELEELYGYDPEEDLEGDQDETPVIAPAAKLPAETIEYDQAAEELEDQIVHKVLPLAQLNRDWCEERDALVKKYKNADTEVERQAIRAEVKTKAKEVPNGVLIKAQVGVGKSRLIREHFINQAVSTKERKDKTAIYCPDNELAGEQLESLDPEARKAAGTYHKPEDVIEIDEDNMRVFWCQHQSRRTARKMGLPINRLCNNGGNDGGKCPYYSDCSFRKNNDFLKESDHHMIASHAAALSRTSSYTGKFDNIILDEEILNASLPKEEKIDIDLLSDKLFELDLYKDDVGIYEAVDRDQVRVVLEVIGSALKASKVQFEEDLAQRKDEAKANGSRVMVGVFEAPLDLDLITVSRWEIDKAIACIQSNIALVQDHYLSVDFSGVDGNTYQYINNLKDIVEVLNEINIARDSGFKLSGRVLIGLETGKLILRQRKQVDENLLQSGYPILLDATPPNLADYSGMFDFNIRLKAKEVNGEKVREDEFVRVHREFEIIEHTPVNRAESVKIIQVVGAPVSSTKLANREVGKAFKFAKENECKFEEPSEGKRNRRNVEKVVDLLRSHCRYDSMLICNQNYAAWLGEAGFNAAGWLSTGKLAGTNRFEQSEVGVIVGHPRLSPDEPFRKMGQLTGRYCEDGTSSKVKRSIQLIDGETRFISGYKINDQRVDDYSNWMGYKSFIQGSGRLRPLSEKGFDQTVFIISDHDTGMVIDDVIEWSPLLEFAQIERDEKEISDLIRKMPVSGSWKVNQKLGISQPVEIADKIGRKLIRSALDVNPYRFFKIIKGKTTHADLIRIEVLPVAGGPSTELYFTSSEELQDYIKKHDIPYKLADTVEWSADAVALTKGDIKLQQGVSNDKASELSKQLTASIPATHTVVEFKTITNGVAPKGKWRRAAVRAGVDAIEAIHRCLSVSDVVLREG